MLGNSLPLWLLYDNLVYFPVIMFRRSLTHSLTHSLNRSFAQSELYNVGMMCVRSCVRACLCVCVYMCVSARAHVRVCARARVCVCGFVRMYIFVGLCTHVFTNVFMCKGMFVRMYAYLYVYPSYFPVWRYMHPKCTHISESVYFRFYVHFYRPACSYIDLFTCYTGV